MELAVPRRGMAGELERRAKGGERADSGKITIF
jgi:hypothetical protein